MLESTFQTRFKERLEDMFPGCIVFKVNTSFRQGAPDLFMIWGTRWAAFELKRSHDAAKQRNQEYYVGQFNEMSFAAFVEPENLEDVLYDLQRSLSR